MRIFFKTLAYTLAYLVSLLMRPKGVPVLMYHSVDTAGWRYGVHPEAFEKQMRFLAAHRAVVKLEDVVAYARGEKKLPKNAVAITIDDGYLDTYTTAFPILKKYKISATVFLTSDLSRIEALGNLDRPTWEQIQEMHESGLVSFEVHGRKHVRLTDIVADEQALDEELLGCAEDIQNHLGYTPNYVAYSFGAKNNELVAYVEKTSFTAAFSIFEGLVKPVANLFSLRRVQVDRTMPFLLFALRTTGAVESYRILKKFFTHD